MRALIVSLVLLFAPSRGADLPKVLFFGNPMTSDNDVVRRAAPNELSVAERHFADLSKGIFDATITQEGTAVTPEKLAAYKAVVFFTAINPPGVDVDGLVDWVRQGGGFVGIHSTANTYQGHAGFGEMLGARYDRRPWRTREHSQTKVRIQVNDRTHPATKHLPQTFEIADDIYQFKNFDVAKMTVLLSLDPASLDLENPSVNRADKHFPMAWAKSHGQGRVFYTALGDWENTWKDPRYRTHLIEGIRWAIGEAAKQRDEKLAPP
jgi:type 1 glutamine amidotransferase